MIFIPFTWFKWLLKRTDFIKANSRPAALVLALLCLPGILSACVLICKNNLNVSLNSSGTATLTPIILLEDPSCDPNDFTVDILDPSNNSIGNTITCEYIGMTMTAKVIETSTGNYCTTIVTVEDYINPQIQCTDTVLYCNQSVDPSDIGYPTATDNCTVFANTDFTYDDEFMDLACFSEVGMDTVTAQIQRTWSVQDESGNAVTCIQMIYLMRATIDDVMFPANLNGFENPALDCGQDPTDLSITGEPLINGSPIEVAGSCELVVSYSDQVAPICGSINGAYRILRTWQVVDYCSGDFTLRVQVINLEDTTVPEVTCPADLTISTLQNECNATVILNNASATDDCSTITVEPNWAFGSGLGPFFGVPIGNHTVNYTATDECGNFSTCNSLVTVRDNVAPTPVCDSGLTVNLSSNGLATVPASTIDNGSFDNCGVDSIRISRDGLFFGTHAIFDCNDIEQSPISVMLRVWDTAENYNDCSANVTIDDKLIPTISCPSATNISCVEDYTNFSIVGQAIATDNCGIDTLYHIDSLDLNLCSVGTILRTWATEDENGNSNNCLQTITITDNTPLGITWPNDYVTSNCVASLEPETTGEPVFINNDCEQLYVSYEDEYFYNSPSCYRILRTWSVYEWCTYDGSSEGLWLDVQVIDVEDYTAPTISCASDTTFTSYANNCEAIFIALAIPTATDCNPNLAITNNSPYANENGGDASGYYPNGMHVIQYVAADGCGNTNACSRTIQVVDAKVPTPICSGGVNVNIGQNGSVSITTLMIDYGSYDNCTIEDNLIRSVSPSTFTCESLGPQEVTLTITDEAGNSAFCTTIVEVQDNANICNSGNAMITGSLTNVSNNPILGVELILSGAVEDTLMCDENGNYTFPDLPVGESYTITPYKNSNPTNGVTTFDIVLMQRHILGIQALNSPYKMIAADVNKSGGISTFDLVRLRRLILELDTVVINNTSWRFVEEDFAFPDPANPWITPFPESITLTNLDTDMLDANFIGIKVGDINLNANPSELGEGSADDRSATALKLFTSNFSFNVGEIVEVPIYAEDFNQILGYQFSLEFDEEVLDFKGFQEGDLPLDEGHFNFNDVAQGIITTSWSQASPQNRDINDPLFVLSFEAKAKGELSEILKLSSKKLKVEAYDEQLRIKEIIFDFFQRESAKKEQFMLYQNYPNPIIEQTIIPFDLAIDSDVLLQITDVKGIVVWRRSLTLIAGHHQQKLIRSELPAVGTYFLTATTSKGESQTRSILVQ
jgi:hypothetical protein